MQCRAPNRYLLSLQFDEIIVPTKDTSLLIFRHVSWEITTGHWISNWHNKQQSDWCNIPLDGFPIGSGTLARDLGGITSWNPWSNKSDANLENSACTVRVLLFFPMGILSRCQWFGTELYIVGFYITPLFKKSLSMINRLLKLMAIKNTIYNSVTKPPTYMTTFKIVDRHMLLLHHHMRSIWEEDGFT